MVMFYMVILCVSTMLGAWISLRAMRRFAPVLHITPAAGWCLLMPILGFLTVVGTPPSVLMAAFVSALAMVYLRERGEAMLPRLLFALIAALFSLRALHTAPFFTQLPAVALLGIALLVSWGLVFAGSYVPATAKYFLPALGGAALLVMAAPLQVPSAMPVAYDAAIVVSAVLGLTLVGKVGALPIHAGVRMAAAVLVAYLAVDALWRGAWIPAVLALTLWLGAIGWAWVQDDQWSDMRA